jgi:glycosyltransferase involved in cell wall biosynthesis
MRIVVDLQGAQSTGSRNRGIGRYSLSLALAMAKQKGSHEMFIALNGAFPETIDPIREAFTGLLPAENVVVWQGLTDCHSIDTAKSWRRCSSELIRETFLASLAPDIIHVSSVFEGLGDDAATSIGRVDARCQIAVTLYDIIPYLNQEIYLQGADVRRWYTAKLESLKRSDLLLSISECSRQDAIAHLHLSDDRIVNIAGDADDNFRVQELAPRETQALRSKYGITGKHVMYTGGIDHRKNIETLIRSHALLPADLRQNHQLVIVCHAREEEKQHLYRIAAEAGLEKGEMVLTGFVPDEDLVALYNDCSLFVFPSKYEGFGLPVLEAMRCGAPVIGSNVSSIPEVIEMKEALFDPHCVVSLAALMRRGLCDGGYRELLIANSKRQEKKFAWSISAARTLEAMERIAGMPRSGKTAHKSSGRPKLAYVSPFPPDRSGIAEYSAELVPHLSEYYDIDVVCNHRGSRSTDLNACYSIKSPREFQKTSGSYDRVVYQFGNSAFHEHMFDLLEAVPGVVVLHDFFLSGVLAHMDVRRWVRELHASHGWPAVSEFANGEDKLALIYRYPCNLSVLQNSLWTIVHSDYSQDLLAKWYGFRDGNWTRIPHLRKLPSGPTRSDARRALGISEDYLLVCSFGSIAPTKLNDRLVRAWLESPLSKNRKARLVFVGENDAGPYGVNLMAQINNPNHQNSIQVTGFADSETYNNYLAAADIAVQLRSISRGESSGAVFDCMKYGVPTIVNANGALDELENGEVWKLTDHFTDEDLTEALASLAQDNALRHTLSTKSKLKIQERHDPRQCALNYYEVIEGAYSGRSVLAAFLPGVIGSVKHSASKKDMIDGALAIARTFPVALRQRQVLFDTTGFTKPELQGALSALAKSGQDASRQEFVMFDEGGFYVYDRKNALKILGRGAHYLNDEAIDFAEGDVLISRRDEASLSALEIAARGELIRAGVEVRCSSNFN